MNKSNKAVFQFDSCARQMEILDILNFLSLFSVFCFLFSFFQSAIKYSLLCSYTCKQVEQESVMINETASL